jgi:hypothetical protein
MIILLVVLAMTPWRRGIPDCRGVNPSHRAVHLRRGGSGRLNAMRIFYLVVTMLLIISLGLLEVVAARSVSLTP